MVEGNLLVLKPSLIGIQETKCSDLDESWARHFWGSENFGFAQVKAQGKSGGLATIWDPSVFSAKQTFGEEGFLVVLGNWKGIDGICAFVNVYGPHLES